MNRSVSGVPGDAAPFDLVLTPQKSVETARMVVETLKKRGVCVIKAGADKDFQRSCAVEAKLLLDSGEFAQGQKGQLTEPAGDRVEYSFRDDIVLWMTTAWHERQDRKGNALKVLDQQLTDFGLGLKPLLEEELGLYISKRSLGMLSCYDGGITPGARYDFHVDNPYQTQMETRDDKRRLTVIYYISDAPWDVKKDGGAFQVCLSNPRKAPRTTTEALQHPKLTVSPASDTLVVFFSHTMYHAVLPVLGNRKRFALSTWFQGL